MDKIKNKLSIILSNYRFHNTFHTSFVIHTPNDGWVINIRSGGEN